MSSTRSASARTRSSALRLLLAACVAVSLTAGPVGSSVAAAASPTAAAVAPGAAAGTDPIAHDPTMIKQGSWYYVFITGDSGVPNTYLPMKRSQDLIHWQELGPVFTAPPAWIPTTLGVTPADFWAPDISYRNGEYYLYYSASQFGVNNSVIALATNTTLDPASPDYHWVDQGLVLRSVPGDTFNAIDPNVSVDAAGTPWLSYGSFWAGILLRRLDGSTGQLSTVDTAVYPLVDRQWPPNAVEGPSIVRHGHYYYLFASFDYCCRGADSEYRTVVGRATAITGPYVDESGQPMLNGGGTELLRSYNEFAGPGGGSVSVDGPNYWFVHHYYDVTDNGRPKLSVRRLTWRAGWPVLSDPVSGSKAIGHGPAYFSLVEKSSQDVLAAVPGGPAAPLCGYEGDNIALLAPSSANPCLQWRMEDQADGYFALRNRQSNKVFDTAFCGYDDGTNLAQWGWLHNDCQQWRFVPTTDGWEQIQSKNEPGGQSGKLVDAGAGGCTASSNVALWSADPTRCQQFRLQPVGRVLLVSAATNRAVGRYCTAPAAAPFGHLDTSTTTCDAWRFRHTDGPYYSISGSWGNSLPVAGCGSRPTGVAGKPGHGVRACEQWRLDPLNDGTYRLVDRATGKVATVRPASGSHRTGLSLQAPSGSTGQQFTVVLP